MEKEKSGYIHTQLHTMDSAEKLIHTATGLQSWVYTYLPQYAKFIRENHLEEFTRETLRLCREVNLPLLRHLDMLPEEHLWQKSLESQVDFLQHAENNTLKDRTESTYGKWETDDLKVIAQNQLVPEDVISGDYARKQAFAKFIPLYTADINHALAILKEIDDFERRVLLMCNATYTRIMQQQIDRHEYFIDNINNTLPGAIGVYNLTDDEVTYSNKGLENMLGYTQQDREFSGNTFATLVHPDDAGNVREAFNKVLSAPPGEVSTAECRLKKKNGEYIWVRSYISLYKDSNDNAPAKITAFIVDIEEEKQKATMLVNSREQLLEAQELTNMGSYVQDIENDVTEVTPQFLHIYELNSADEMHIARSRIHPADKEHVANAKQQALNDNTLFDCEFRYIIGDREKIIWARGLPFMQHGRQYLRGTIMDVSEKKHMLLKLQRSEILHKQAQLMSHIGNWTWNILRNKLEISDEMYRIYGIPSNADMTMADLLQLVHAEDRQRVKEAIDTAIENATGIDEQYRVITANNVHKVLHTKGQVLIDDEGIPYKIFGTTQDVTREYEINRQLKESRELSKKITDTTPSLITLFNVKTMKFTFINKTFDTLLGHDREQIFTEGVNFVATILHPEEKDYVLRETALNMLKMAERPADGVETKIELLLRIRCAGNSYHWLRTHATVFDRDAAGNIESILTVSVNITGQVEAEQKLKHQNVQLQQSNKHLEEFAYIASHDLKEPLRKISTFGGRLATTHAALLNEEGKMYIDKIISSVRRMQTMIDDLMALSTIGGDKVFAPCNLNTILDETLVTLEYKIQRSNTQVTAGELPTIVAIPSQLRQLFQNLLSNAIKFAHKDREPRIAIHAHTPSTATLLQHNLPQMKEYVQIDVADNGIGFEEEFAEKIFITFQRLHSKSDFEGNGIGLAICRKVVENHNGSIFATSEPGAGSTFTIILPLRQE